MYNISSVFNVVATPLQLGGRCGHDHVVVGFTNTSINLLHCTKDKTCLYMKMAAMSQKF